jgi:hypothetical protein
VLDYISSRLLAQLFRGRPYTKAIPFAKTFAGVAGESVELWLPQNAHFELAGGIVRGTVTLDAYLADTQAEVPFAYVQVPTTTYARIETGNGTYRSLTAHSPRLLLVNPGGVASTVKGVLYGWEVTPEGAYR